MDPQTSVEHVPHQLSNIDMRGLIIAVVDIPVAGIDVYQMRKTSTQIVSWEFPTLRGNTTLCLALFKPPELQVHNPTYLLLELA